MAKCVENAKNTKMEGTNSLKSFRINKSDKKRTQNELVFARKKGQRNSKMGPKMRKMEAGKWKLGAGKSKLGCQSRVSDLQFQLVIRSVHGPPARVRSVESHVIPAKAGIQLLPDMDPRFRGGDVLTFISMGGPPAHVRSE
jgi:hypothetical protein